MPDNDLVTTEQPNTRGARGGVLETRVMSLVNDSPVPMRAWLTYDPACPYEITVTLGPAAGRRVVWRIARDLLLAGLMSEQEWAGAGDVLIRAEPDPTGHEHRVCLRFYGEMTYTEARIALADASRFAGESLTVVPLGAEAQEVPDTPVALG